MKREEQQHCIALMQWAEKAACTMPELKLLYHIPNGGKRTKAEAGILKAMGVRAGIPDYCLPVARGDWHALYVEMKADKGKVSDSQDLMSTMLGGQSNLVVFARGVDEAIWAVTSYLDGSLADAIAQTMKKPNVSYSGRG